MQDPIELFQEWYRHAERKGFWRKILTTVYPPAVVHQPDAVTVVSVAADGRPSARVVLLKDVSQGGFVFYTNYNSRKGQELDARPDVAMVFHWGFPERQIRIEGRATRVMYEESQAYWSSRPRGSQLSALASDQSSPIAHREVLKQRVQELTREYEGREIPCPQHWGGYRVMPSRIEFWEGKVNRLHHRVVYTRDGNSWKTEILAP